MQGCSANHICNSWRAYLQVWDRVWIGLGDGSGIGVCRILWLKLNREDGCLVWRGKEFHEKNISEY